MAITLVTSPNGSQVFAAAVKNFIYTFTSNAANLVHVIARIKLDGAYIGAEVVEADASGLFTLDASCYVTDRFEEKLKTNGYNLRELNDTTLEIMPGMAVSVVLELFEVTGTSAPYTETYPATPQLTTTAKIALNAARQHMQTGDPTIYYWVTPPDTTEAVTAFMTDAPLVKTIAPGESEFLYLPVDSVANAGYIRLKCYNHAGTELFNDTYGVTGVSVGDVICFPVGIDGLNSLFGTTAIDDSTKKYEVYMDEGGPSYDYYTTAIRTYIIDRNYRPLAKRIHWINSYGAIDSYTFTGNWKENINSEYTLYQKRVEPVIYNYPDRAEQVISVSGGYSYMLESEYLKTETSQWLSQIKFSTKWWIEGMMPNGVHKTYIPIQLKPGTIEVQTIERRLPNIKIEYTYANPVNTLRG